MWRQRSKMKRAFLVHGWGGNPTSDWMDWAKKELEKKGYQVHALAMPDTHYPKMKKWIPHLTQVVGEPQATDIFIGHSMGCQTIMRYLQDLPANKIVDRAILVAGFVKLTGLTMEEEIIVESWLNTPLHLDKVKKHANFFIAIFSSNDPFVPLKENSQIFQTKLGAKIVVERNQGHFNDAQLPVLLEFI